MNLPNKLTMLRLLLVPLYVVAMLLEALPHRWLITGVLFGIAAYTDHLDGTIARRQNQITDFGKFMDPLVDKIMVLSAFICFVGLGLIPAWCVILVIAREFMVTSIRLVAASKGEVIAANIWGKIKTVSQILAIVEIMITQYLGELKGMGVQLGVLNGETAITNVFPVIDLIVILLATLLTVLSGAIYIVQNWSMVCTAK